MSQAEIGARIRERRTALQLTQRELARRAGVDSVLLWKYEQGRVLPRIDMVERIATALGVTMDWLTTGRVPRRGGKGVDMSCGKTPTFAPKLARRHG